MPGRHERRHSARAERFSKDMTVVDTIYELNTGLGKQIALVTDLHNEEESGAAALASMKRRQLDLIAVCGDLFLSVRPDDRPIEESQPHVLPFLRACAEIAPTYVTLGNHEWGIAAEDLEKMRQTGAVILDDSWVRIGQDGNTDEIGGAGDIVLGGMTSRGYRFPVKIKIMPDEAWLKEFERQEGYHILLCHHPEYWCLQGPLLRDHPIELVLSGHAHGGQVRIFGQGLHSPGQGNFPQYTKGIYEGPHGKLIVSTGLANTGRPVPRWGNPREVVYIKL